MSDERNSLPPDEGLPTASASLDPELRSLEVLEWGQIRQTLADRCRSAAAERLAFGLEPSRDRSESLERLAETGEAHSLKKEGLEAPVGTVRDLAETLDDLDKTAILEPQQLLDIASVLETSASARKSLEACGDEAPRLSSYGARLADFGDLLREIRRCIEPGGEVSDSASPELQRCRKRVAAMGEEVRARIRKVVADPGLEPVLQERFFTVRDGRYVVPVRREARSGLRGIVHGRSSSGASLFVEPESVVEANNEYRIAQEEEHEEILRILGSLTESVRNRRDELRAAFDVLVHLDFTWAKAMLAVDMEAVIPRVEDQPILELPSARHPLLALRESDTVVPNDITLGTRASFLIVTGPNTGGKTVAMKTAGLAVLMARAGLAVPAAPGARLGYFPRVLADLGDEQSLERHLSSFSGHLHRVQEIRAHAGSGSLILLDELVSGTDPREGAALARAILEDLATGGACGIVTTHYQELKAMASEDPRFRNAGMEFDLESMQPTFRMIYDLPGRSSALSVARRFGLEADIVKRAEELQGEEGLRLEALLEEIEELRRRVESEEQEAARARKEAERLARDREREVDRLRKRDQEYLGQEEALLGDALARARDEARRIAKRLENETNRSRVEEARRRLKEIERESRERLRSTQSNEPDESPADLSDLREGQRVWLRQYGKQATVLGPEGKGGVPVAVGPVRMTVPVTELELAGSKRQPARTTEPASSERRESGDDIPFTHQLSTNAVDLRGKTVEEALAAIDAFLDGALRRRISPVVIIHGHGTGALRRAVREHLTGSPYVSRLRPGRRGEGEDGVTIAALSD